MLRHLARAAPRHARATAACHASTAAAAGVQGSLRVPDFPLERGSTLDVELVYKTYGSPGKPCILHPTSFDAKHVDLEYAIGPGRILDTDAYFVVVPNMVGNGLSTSPSTVAPHHRAAFPLVTVGDNVRLQHTLLTRHLGIQSLALVYGYSMGAMQALHWAALYPSLVRRVVATCGTASCHQYNAVFLEGLLAILGPPQQGDGGDAAKPNMGAFGRVYAGWGLPDSWYRQELWRRHGGHASLDAFLTDSWEKWTTSAVPDDMRCQLRTWRDGALTLEQLGGITAQVVYLPSRGDRYFNLPDVTSEACNVRGARIVPLSTDWGHRAGDPHRQGQERDYAVIRAAVHDLLRT